MPIDFRNLGGGGSGGGAALSTLPINALSPTYNTPNNGVTPATTQIQAIHDASANKESYFPAGRYLLTGSGLFTRVSGAKMKGAGMWATTFVADLLMPYMMQPGGFAADLVFEDMGFESQDGTGFMAALSGNFGSRITFRRCRFHNFARALQFQAMTGITIEDCLFTNPGGATGDGIYTSGECRDIKILRNTFWYVHNAILMTGNAPQITDTVEIEGNYFDLGWWLLTPLASGSGASVSYTATVLTDSSKDFTVLLPSTTSFTYYVRVMKTRRTGSGTGVTYPYATNSLVDTGANFVTSGVLKGEIVRVGTGPGAKFGVVSAVESETVLYVEQWLSDADRTPTQYPNAGTAYTVYAVYMGAVLSRTTTTVTVADFYDLTGLRVTPTATTYYELTSHSGYCFNAESGVRNIRVVNNTFRRGWSDQCSIFGDRFQVIANFIEYGQDMGITVQPPTASTGYSTIVGNRIHHQGTGGIFLGGSYTMVSGNIITESTWTTTDPTVIAGIICYQVRNSIMNNIIDGNLNPQSRMGICVTSNDSAFPATDNMICNNELRGHTFADIRLAPTGSGTMSGTHLDFNRTYSTTKISPGFQVLGVNYDVNQPEDGISVSPTNGYGFNGATGPYGGMWASGTSLIFRTLAAGATAFFQDTVGAGAPVAVGPFGANGVTPVGKQTLGNAATDLASVITLANNLRAMAIADGLGQT